ncbi:GPCR fungal pheromone mating factor [Mycena epipterygia]|nr:GPCR fungal pheromone mating factor [Mycena epipterygia]
MSGALSAVAFIAFIFVLVPLLLHWKSRNIPLLSLFCWLALSNLTYGINSAIWNGNVNIVIPVWCDITTKIKIGADVAPPVCALALALQVYRITLQKPQLGTRLELGVCFGFPFIIMILHTIVQGHRFDIYEGFGCNPAIYLSIPSIMILDVPPLIAAALALVYCSLALVNFSRQRQAFSRIVQNSQSPGLSKSRYFRLMSLTFVLGVWDALVICLTRASAYRNGLLPWTTWDDVHSYFWLISQYPTALVPSDVLEWLYFSWASVPITSLFAFVFFAFGAEAMRDYRACARWVETTILRRETVSDSQPTLSAGPSNRLASTKDGSSLEQKPNVGFTGSSVVR